MATATTTSSTTSVTSTTAARTPAPASVIAKNRIQDGLGAFNPCAPFGGVGCSGHGRDLGAHGLEEFFYLKWIQC